MITLFNYRKSYGDHLIIEIGEKIFDQGIHWIKGQNGSGKTTLLKSIAGIIPFEGKIEIGGYDSHSDAYYYRKQVSISEAEPVFPDYLSAWELIDFYKNVKPQNEGDLNALTGVLGIDQFMHQQCGGYSAGMLKKLSICLALIGQPEWILLDEPFAFIDQKTEKSLENLINEYAALGSSFIITSHHEVPFNTLSIYKTYSILDKKLIG